MRCPYQVATAVLLFVILGNFSVAQSGRSRLDPAAHETSVKPRDSFLDFTLKRINPSDKDFGQCLSEGRTVLIEQTIRNAYFWSNIVSLFLLGCLFCIVLCQHRIQAKREWTVAEIVGQLEQNLIRSRAQVAEATRKNRELADALTVLRETASRSVSLPLESPVSSVGATEKSRAPKIQPALPAPAKVNPPKPQNGNGSTAKEPVAQMRLFTPDADFVMKLNSLEQQLAQSREDNKQLRRRIADGDRKLEAEQLRNRQLKGA
jgi:hypothetical protein